LQHFERAWVFPLYPLDQGTGLEIPKWFLQYPLDPSHDPFAIALAPHALQKYRQWQFV
jgi:hypothetical protein